MHAVINDYRPHQAMATVRAMLESQLERRQSTEAALHTYVNDIQMVGLQSNKNHARCTRPIRYCNRYYSAVDEVAQRCVRDILPRAEAHYAEFERFEKEIKAALEKRKPIAGTKVCSYWSRHRAFRAVQCWRHVKQNRFSKAQCYWQNSYTKCTWA
jgi:hypothetical protein